MSVTSEVQGLRALNEVDPEIAELIRLEERREADTLRLIASENYVSRAVLEATGSVLTNKYSEGYPHKRYYEGQQQVDVVEELARTRVAKLFGADHVNVQPYSGSPANLAVYLAFAQANDTIMGLGLPAGGHLTHGWSVSITGKYFKSVPYGVRESDHRIDLDQVRDLARAHRPKLIWCGTTAYPRTLDFAAFRAIADEVGAILAADIAHIAGLVAAGVHPSPVGIADVVTSTTHKTFRGPRGAMILCKKEHAGAIDKAVFPGLQGGPHNHTTAAIAVAAKEASEEGFRAYARQIVVNAQALGRALESRGFRLITGGTDNHLLLIDMTPKGIAGKPYAQALDRAGIVANYNSIPFDPRKPFDPSGLRIGTPAVTSRGMGVAEMERLAAWMDEVAQNVNDEARIARIAAEVAELCRGFPAPGIRL
ncbi:MULTISPECIES: serine hydroxymethyltransferase [Sorangium]|uniref:Serine hydroxymethyltransferase n=1 Tax=Sorangium cellulosum (strain So ce56) TaxID=448385 RepID=GLYA_SORC5|nr:serine hydroxymethyltransferase [Sorangium cellulosum]A9GPH2.1 RecName: Full=Serine hydroxymethyltransferase; Short=SHMT; Short=Serine methylase [Sorangium cellulosum So ce56]CAN96756.1 Glycine hydroxymethyltransferase [Sorangium cellulosum So ce56]